MLLAVTLGTVGCRDDGGTSAEAATPTARPAMRTATPAVNAETPAAQTSATVLPLATALPRTCAPPYPASPPTPDSVFCADPRAMPAAPVVRIVDGDTLRVVVDGREQPLRVFGIDADERGEACFDEAAVRMRELAAAEVRLAPDARDRDRFGRLLRYLYTPAGLSIDAVLIEEGLARAWRDDGALRLPLIALEDRARAAGRGCLWG